MIINMILWLHPSFAYTCTAYGYVPSVINFLHVHVHVHVQCCVALYIHVYISRQYEYVLYYKINEIMHVHIIDSYQLPRNPLPKILQKMKIMNMTVRIAVMGIPTTSPVIHPKM